MPSNQKDSLALRHAWKRYENIALRSLKPMNQSKATQLWLEERHANMVSGFLSNISNDSIINTPSFNKRYFLNLSLTTYARAISSFKRNSLDEFARLIKECGNDCMHGLYHQAYIKMITELTAESSAGLFWPKDGLTIDESGMEDRSIFQSLSLLPKNSLLDISTGLPCTTEHLTVVDVGLFKRHCNEKNFDLPNDISKLFIKIGRLVSKEGLRIKYSRDYFAVYKAREAGVPKKVIILLESDSLGNFDHTRPTNEQLCLLLSRTRLGLKSKYSSVLSPSLLIERLMDLWKRNRFEQISIEQFRSEFKPIDRTNLRTRLRERLSWLNYENYYEKIIQPLVSGR